MTVTHHMPPGRECKRAPLTLQDLDADGTFAGYASLFGEVDLGRDMVMRGAFAKSLRTRGAAGLRMLWQHDPAEPIGRWETVREDHRGLFVKGRLALGVSRAREVLDLMRAGALDGLSIGFRTVKARSNATTGVRSILEADLWEISVVTFPMLPSARIGSVKSGRKPTLREFERWLVRDAGLSRSEARGVIRDGYASVAGGGDAACDEPHSLAAVIRDAARLFHS